MTVQGKRRALNLTSVLAWALCLILLALGLSIAQPPHHVEYRRIVNGRGVPVWVVVYFPDPPLARPLPAAVICQSFNNPPEYARLIALELVRDGFVALTFDWRGRARGENRQLMRAGTQEVLRADVAAAVAYLRNLPAIDPARIVVAGHSVGGTLAIEAAANDPSIAAVAAIGTEADVAPDRPRNLLWAVGLYDEFRSLDHMRGVFQISVGRAAAVNTMVGSFGRGTARRLDVSPSSDHFTELQDREIHRRVLEWFHEALALPSTSHPLRMETRTLLLESAWMAALWGAVLTLRQLASRRRWVLRGAAALALLAVVLLTWIRVANFLVAADAVLLLATFVLVAGFIGTRNPETWERAWRMGVRAGAVLWLSLLLTLVVNNLANYLKEPRFLAWLPEFALRHPLDGLHAYFFVASRPILFTACNPEAFKPRLWIYVLFAGEILFPGLLLGSLAWAVRPQAEPSPRSPRRWLLRVALLALLLVGLAVLAWLRVQQGFLTPESTKAALRFLVRFAALPIFLFAVFWRWSARLLREPPAASRPMA